MTHQLKEPEKAVLSREEFLSRIKVTTKSVTVPKFGEITVRGLTASEVQKIKSGSTKVQGGKPDEDMFAILTVMTGLVAPKLLTEDIAALKENGQFWTIHKISGEIWEMSGVNNEVKNA